MGKRKQQSFEYGAVILIVSTALSKIIGAIFKIPLANLLTTDGMGSFSSAYELFTPIYGLAMAGLPIAISRMVAESMAQKRFRDARAILKLARKAFTVTGIVGFGAMLAFTKVFVNATDPSGKSIYSILMIAPSLLFCCISSIYRGYYEGMRNMYPTAISDIIEAASKLLLGYTAAYIILQYTKNVDYAAAGAIMGVTVGTALSSAFLAIRHKIRGDGITAEELATSPEPATQMVILRSLAAIAIPVVLTSIATNVASFIDVFMVKWQIGRLLDSSLDTLKTMYAAAIEDYNLHAVGEALADDKIPNFLFGVRSQAFTIYNLVPTIASVLGVSALPLLASVWTTDRTNKPAVRKSVESVIKLTAVIAFPAGIGMAVMSTPIMALLYGDVASVQIGGPMLALFGISAVFAGLSAPMTSILQAIGKQMIPVRNIAIGAVIKIVVNFVLVGIPEINILGAPIGTLCSFVFVFTANLICLIKYTGVCPNFFGTMVKPLLSALMCGGAAFTVYYLAPKGGMFTICAIAAAGIVYIAMLFILRTFTEDDVLALPAGKKLLGIFKRLHLIR
ncbi:MAG: polysaccharide biosynthesis protein [Clostridia bacterium]|nr:polysaccharide biosynthesis protein [Clostridia bacterium]